MNKKKKLTLLYNPHCSTCHKVYDIAKGQKCEIELVEYLNDVPTEKQLKDILKKLGLKAEDLLRKKEALYQEKYKDKKFTDSQWIKVMHKNPILIERPVAIYGNKAIIGRPPERIIELLK